MKYLLVILSLLALNAKAQNTYNVNQIVTNIIFNPTEFVTQTHTSTPDSVRIYSGTNLATSVVAGANMDIYLSGGGGLDGNISINSYSSNIFTFVGTNGIVVRTTNNTIEIGQTLIPDSFIGTNRATYQFTGGDSIFTVPAGITNILIWAWGGGGSGASAAGNIGIGGHSFNLISTYGGEQFQVTVGQGGLYDINTNGYGRAAYGGGGRGYTTNTSHAVYSGAGASYVRRLSDSNIVIVAGGAGAVAFLASTAMYGGYGGGISGGDGSSGTASKHGFGGTQVSGGDGEWFLTAVTNAIVQPTAGSFLQGGDGGFSTNSAAAGAGAGGGYYGGGGHIHDTAVSSSNTGGSSGGGSGFDGVGVTGVVFGVTYRQSANTATSVGPIGNDLPFYVSGVGVRANSTTSAGGPGQITIGY